LLPYPSFQLIEGMDNDGPTLFQLTYKPSSNLRTKHHHRFATRIEITIILKPLYLSKFLSTFATGNLDDGRFKFHIDLANETPLNPDFVLKGL
jgi:hypothetical protein